MMLLGITLFTYHKYRKSIESTVPLDDHGYPVTLEDVDGHDDGGAYVELDQTDRTHASTVRTESEAVSQIYIAKCEKLLKMIFRIRNQHTQIANYYFLQRARKMRRSIGVYDLPKFNGIPRATVRK